MYEILDHQIVGGDRNTIELELGCPLCGMFIGWATVVIAEGETVEDVVDAESAFHAEDCDGGDQ